MGPDFSFFALLLVIAQALAPNASQELTWINGDHPDQTITWRRDGDAWRLAVNEHPMGRFYRHDGAVVLHQEGGPPQRFALETLSAPITQGASRVQLRGSFAPTVLSIERDGGTIRLSDPRRQVLRMVLTLRAQ